MGERRVVIRQQEQHGQVGDRCQLKLLPLLVLPPMLSSSGPGNWVHYILVHIVRLPIGYVYGSSLSFDFI